MERTLSILKPDATKKNITGAINQMIEEAGFRIIAQKRIKMTLANAEAFYAVHKDKPFFGMLTSVVSAGPIVVQVLEKDNAIQDYRNLMGATNPQEAAAGTIRAKYGENIDINTVHGSDAPETAAEEIRFFFRDDEIVG